MGRSSSVVLKTKNTDLESRLKSFTNMRTQKKRKRYCEEDLKRRFNSMVNEYKNTEMSDGRKPVWVGADLVFGFVKEKGEYDGHLGPYEKRVMTEVIDDRKDTKFLGRSNRKGKKFYFVGRFKILE